MDDKAIRAAKLTLGAMMEKRRAETAKSRAQGQIAPSKYLPDVPRQVHANGGKATFTQGNHHGVPDVVYHGTNGDFTAFRPDGIHWFTSDKMDAADYRPKRIVEAHLSLKNPADLDAPKVKSVLKKGGFDPENLYDLTQSGNAVKSLLMGMGYDGIMVSRPDVDKGVMHYAVFHPHQIKSATDNNGNFDPNNPDITKATGGGVSRQVHANGGYVPQAHLPIPKLAVAKPLRYGSQPSGLEALANMAGAASSLGDSAATIMGKEGEQPPAPPQDSHAGRAEAGGGMSTGAVAAYNALLEAYGKPLTVVSDYRTPSENQRVGGAKGSQHMHGNAYDFDTSHLSHDERLALADQAWDAGFRGIGFYDNNMHFDVGDPRAWGPSYSRDSIPEWALPWAQQRYGYADGGEVTDLGQVRDQRQLQTFHKGMMSDMSNSMSQAMEAHQKAVDAGAFDGYEIGDVLKGRAGPMKITGRYVQKWKPSAMTLQHFDRMGAKPTIIEHEGQQYVPMLRYTSGSEQGEDNQEGTLYLDAVKAAGYPKMGGLRAVKADGGSVDDPRATFLAGNHPDVPEVVYHGAAPKTAYKGWTSEIDPERTQKNIDAMDFREFRPSEHGSYGQGIYLTDKPDVASKFAMGIRADHTEAEPHGQVMKLHVSMKQPFTDDTLRHPAWKDYIKRALTRFSVNAGDLAHRNELFKKLDDGTATVRDLFVRDDPRGVLVNQYGQHDIHDTIRNSGFDGIIAHRPDGSKEIVAFKPEQIKSAISATTFDQGNPDITKAKGGSVGARADFVAGNHPDVPPVVYHATKADFHEFRPLSHFGTAQAAHDRFNDKWHPAHLETSRDTHGVNVMPVHISLKNPLDVGPERDWQSNRDTLRQVADAMFKSGRMDREYLKAAEKIYDLVDDKRWGSDPRAAEQRGADLLREAGHDGIVYTNRIEDPGSRSFVTLGPEQVKSSIGNRGTFDPTHPDMTYADGGYVPQKTVKAYKLFRKRGDNLLPLFVNADKPVEMGKWLEAEEGPQGKAQGKVKSKLGDLAYRPGWHAGDLPIATHIGGKSSNDLKKPDYRPDDQVWAEVEMAADKDWQSVADSRGKGVKAHITDQVPLKGFYRYKTNPNMTGNWLIGGHMKVNRVLSDDEVKAINDQAGVADLPRLDRIQKADGGIVDRSPMFEGMSEHLLDDDGKPMELWHGTTAPEPFEAFDDSKIGRRDPGFYGRGHYLTPDRGVAEGYADPDEMGRGSVMGPLHAALKNPYVWDVSDDSKAHSTLRDLQSMGVMKGHDSLMPWSNLQRHHIDPFMAEMQRRGHDGVIYKTGQGVKEVVVFKPSAIKHRDAEVGDPNDPRIMRAGGGKVDLYSKAARIVRGLKDNPMQVEDIIKYATGKGAKPAELNYVDLPRGGKARPSQVADHIEGMQPVISTIRKERPDFRFGSDAAYDAEIQRLEQRGLHDQANALNEEWERFAGYGGTDEPKYARFQLDDKAKNYREHILSLENHQGPTYTANQHWGRTPNPLVHVRMSDRMVGNKKILHVEELQSDWNNQARKYGFRTGKEQQEYDDYVAKMRQDAVAKIDPTASPMIRQALTEKYQSMDPYMLAMKVGRQAEHHQMALNAMANNAVPQAPYIDPKRDDASELGMKHVLMEAAKGGYDGIAFTPDEAQEERWPGHQFKGIYNKKLPSMAQRLVQQHDPETDDDMMHLSGWAVPMIPLSEQARDSINKNGFSSFRRGGYVTHVRRAR